MTQTIRCPCCEGKAELADTITTLRKEGLMQFCRQNSTPHPGFVVLDSPLLSYREPDNAADDLRSTDLNDTFYGYLASLPDDRQVIIVENTDPPAAIQASQKAIKFTGIKGTGRTGYFPEPEPPNSDGKAAS